MTPASFLSERLAEVDPEALAAVAIVADVELKIARRAAAGEPIAASAALCLFAARGYDPMTFEQIERKRIGPFNHQTLALFLNQYMRKHRRSVRNVSAKTKMNPRVVQAILETHPVNINNIVKACSYLGIHPFQQCDQVKEAA
jgi:hypothetical protein